MTLAPADWALNIVTHDDKSPFGYGHEVRQFNCELAHSLERLVTLETKPLECLHANEMLQKIACHQAKCDDT